MVEYVARLGAANLTCLTIYKTKPINSGPLLPADFAQKQVSAAVDFYIGARDGEAV